MTAVTWMRNAHLVLVPNVRSSAASQVRLHVQLAASPLIARRRLLHVNLLRIVKLTTGTSARTLGYETSVSIVRVWLSMF